MLKFNSRGKPWRKPSDFLVPKNYCRKIDFFKIGLWVTYKGSNQSFFYDSELIVSIYFFTTNALLWKKGHTHSYIYIQSRFYFTNVYNTQSCFLFTMSEVSIVSTYVFFKRNNIITACNAFTDSTSWGAHDLNLFTAASPVAGISMTTTARELQ